MYVPENWMKTGWSNEKFMSANHFTFISLENFGRVSFDLQNSSKNSMNKLARAPPCFTVGKLGIIRIILRVFLTPKPINRMLGGYGRGTNWGPTNNFYVYVTRYVKMYSKTTM